MWWFLQILLLFFVFVFFMGHFNVPTISLKKKKEKKPNRVDPTITFFSKGDTKDFLKEDKDEFFSSLDKPNRLARKVNHINEYKTITSKAAYDFTQQEKNLLTQCIKNVCDKLYGLSEKTCNKFGMKQENLWKLLEKWNLAKTKDRVLEHGLPHTRENVIFLSTYYLAMADNNEDKITRTLLHEFYHIYQRTYKKEYDQFLKDNDWEIVPYNKTDKRMNPDLDDNVWKRTTNAGEKIYIAKFNSLQPSGLSDININDPSNEHPNEYYAYLLTKEINL